MRGHLVRRGADFDVILTTNMFGDVLSDLTGELGGCWPRYGSGQSRVRPIYRRSRHRESSRDNPLRRDAPLLAGRRTR
jgi:hypothetical protein